ncbi:MAG: ABC transporter substrate-binding protein [Alphaproteobacteria bacterium]|nr:ABC transporter substrate-binding protein [Alphaproteobacteria bacterium]
MFIQVTSLSRSVKNIIQLLKHNIHSLNQFLLHSPSFKLYTSSISLLKPICSFAGIFCYLLLSSGCDQQEAKKVVAITQIIAHPSADAVTQGVKDGLAAAGYIDGKNITLVFENAQGSIATSIQIAQKFIGMRPDVIIPITTPSTQAVISAARSTETPIIFSAVTDPIHANVVTDMMHPGGNVTGTTDAPPISSQLALIKEIMPNLEILGVLYNPGETTPAKIAQQVDDLSREMGFRVIKISASKVPEVPLAFQKAVKEVDAIYVPLDNTVLAAMEQVVSLSYEHNVPVFSSDSHSVTQGAVASVGFSHYETGRKTAEMVIRLFKGEKPGNMRVTSPATTDIYLNLKSADKLGILLAESLVKKAKRVTR